MAIRPQRKNANRHTQRGMGLLESSIEKDGWIGAITTAADGETFDGSARVEVTARMAMLDDPIVIDSDGTRPIVVRRVDIPNADDPRAKRLGVAANRVGQVNLEWEPDVLAALAEEMDLGGLFRPDELAEYAQPSLPEPGAENTEEVRATLAERFGVPPFSVLDARQGYWQERKRAWIALGIQSELGRGQNALDMSATMAGITDPEQRAVWNEARRVALGEDGRRMALDGEPSEKRLKPSADQARKRGLARTNGQDLMRGEGTNVLPGRQVRETATEAGGLTHGTTIHPYDATGKKRNGQGVAHPLVDSVGSRDTLPEQTGLSAGQSGTSIFDPVLCELVYRWFCPEGGAILDPFAGGSVRGIVATQLGRQYTGIDLRSEQIEANKAQAQALAPDASPRWIIGDSRNVAELAPGEYDLIFSCPPYADLEVYSDDPADLSTLEYSAFIDAYRAIVRACVGMLKDNRFACFTVGDIRDKRGFYRNFVSDTIAAFEDVGALLYNEAILVTAVGSLPIRIAKQFEGYRKLGKTHQNVLVFYKGDPKRIKNFGPVDMGYSAEGLTVERADG